MRKEAPPIKLSKKSQFRIKAAVKKAFNDVTGEYGCYDSPPDQWMEHERELWDALQELELRALRNLEEIIQTQ